MWGRRETKLTSPIAVLYSYPISWAADGSLGETPESLLKWKTTNEGRIVHLLGFHLDGPALTLFEMQRAVAKVRNSRRKDYKRHLCLREAGIEATETKEMMSTLEVSRQSLLASDFPKPQRRREKAQLFWSWEEPGTIDSVTLSFIEELRNFSIKR
ncbi:hypothetical protein VULLAG_LOCUS15369 [Vulpes lagopus]